MSLRRLRFHRVLYRPQLFLGGEREPALMALIIAGGLAVTGMNVVSFAVGAVLWFGTIPLLRWMAKADPLMTEIYLRHLKYRAIVYAPRPRPYAGGGMSAAKQWAILLAAVIGAVLLYAWRF